MIRLKGVRSRLGSIRRSLRAQRLVGEEGASIVEMAIASAVIFSVLFGVIAFMLALYTYNFVADAAREGSRYAMVRGSRSCTNASGLTNCNIQADTLQTWVQNLSYPGINKNNLNVTTNWLTGTTAGTPPTTTWSTCGSGTCNIPGNIVQVTVSYAFPLNIPFWRNDTLSISSTSEMVISQ